MGQGYNCAVDDPRLQLAWLAEVVGNEHRLAVPRHQSMDGPEQDGCRHGNEDCPNVATCNITQTAGHAAVEPTLDRNKIFHSTDPTTVGRRRIRNAMRPMMTQRNSLPDVAWVRS
jgi:hypothetical protein